MCEVNVEFELISEVPSNVLSTSGCLDTSKADGTRLLI